MHVMLSRATRLEDLLVMRAPGSEFLLRGPPADLSKQLKKFAKRTAENRLIAEQLAKDLGFDEFLH